MSHDLLTGSGYMRLLDAIEAGLNAASGKYFRSRATYFLAALHTAGFDVTEMAGGPVAQRPADEAEREAA